MTTIIETPPSSLPAWNHRLAHYNAGSGLAPITLGQLLQLLHDEETARLEAAFQAFLRAQMTATADRLIEAANGDTAKLQAAITAGEAAALAAFA